MTQMITLEGTHDNIDPFLGWGVPSILRPSKWKKATRHIKRSPGSFAYQHLIRDPSRQVKKAARWTKNKAERAIKKLVWKYAVDYAKSHGGKLGTGAKTYVTGKVSGIVSANPAMAPYLPLVAGVVYYTLDKMGDKVVKEARKQILRDKKKKSPGQKVTEAKTIVKVAPVSDPVKEAMKQKMKMKLKAKAAARRASAPMTTATAPGGSIFDRLKTLPTSLPKMKLPTVKMEHDIKAPKWPWILGGGLLLAGGVYALRKK